jgi:2-polyprenyl-3-methyl-5-hydroxy-6-metoxy-1,4-benzoquinol methylase
MGLLAGETLSRLLPPEGVVADLGCGYGVLANQLALSAPRRKVLGVDADERRIATARSTIAQRNNVEFVCGDVLALALPPLAGAVMVDFLHHIRFPQQREVLEKVVLALEPGGSLLIREVNPAHEPRWKYWCSVLAELAMYPHPSTIKLQNRQPASLLADLEEVGMDARMDYADAGSPFAAVLYTCAKRA